MKKIKSIVFLLLSLFFLIVGTAVFFHDKGYIFRGETADLNERLNCGKGFCRGSLVTYESDMPIKKYDEGEVCIYSFIHTPFKAQKYAVLDKNNIIFTVMVRDKKKIAELDKVIEEGSGTVELKGCLQPSDHDSVMYFQEVCDSIDLKKHAVVSGIVLDTTKTRAVCFLKDIFLLMLSAVLAAAYIRNKLKDVQDYEENN